MNNKKVYELCYRLYSEVYICRFVLNKWLFITFNLCARIADRKVV